MVEWFHERYISRDEHQQVVAYYTKLVAQLYSQVRDLRAAQARAQAVAEVKPEERPAETEAPPTAMPPPADESTNVIRVDFRRPH